jgi:hypothetical protein
MPCCSFELGLKCAIRVRFGLVQRSLWCSGERDFGETATYPSVRQCPSAFGVWVSISAVDVGLERASYYARLAVARQPTLASPDIAS